MTTTSHRLLAATSAGLQSLPRAAIALSRQSARPFSQTCLRRDDNDSSRPSPPSFSFGSTSSSSSSNASTSPQSSNTMARLSAALSSNAQQSTQGLARDTISSAVLNRPPVYARSGDSILGDDGTGGWDPSWGPVTEPFHFHVFSHKHNTHVTVTKPNRNPIISVSAGNLGFRKSKRGTYDAAYQLVAHVMDKLHQGNWHRRMHSLEIVLRSFGQGREAAIKILLGSEGRLFRDKIVRVSDDTKVKFGGTRSRNPRRLG